jgi:hypothetical protein
MPKGALNYRGMVAYLLLFGLLTLMFAAFSDRRLPRENELQSISGVIHDPVTTWSGLFSKKLSIPIKGDDQSCGYVYCGTPYIQDYAISALAPGLLTLNPGDHVSAEFRYIRQRHNSYYELWELQRDGQDVLTYDQTAEYVQNKIRRIDLLIPVGVLLILAAGFCWLMSRSTEE